MKRKSLQGSLCAVARALNVIGDWWSLLIIYEVIAGAKRFGELQRDLGVAKNILATRLKALSAEGIVEAVPASDGRRACDYFSPHKGCSGCQEGAGCEARWSQSRTRDEAKERAKALRPIFAELVGMSARAIAAELNERNVSTPNGGPWHDVTVIRV
jgi:DNA-binding HxlR family transcriptional regulator